MPSQSNVVSIVAFAGVGIAAALLLYYTSTKTDKSSEKPPGSFDSTTGKLSVEFLDATERAKKLEGLGDGEKLVLYALYKQVTEGDAPAKFSAKSWNIIVEKAKYDSWSRLKGMTRNEAVGKYIYLVDTWEGRDELEADDNIFGKAVSQPAVVENGEQSEHSLDDSNDEGKFLLAALQNDTNTLKTMAEIVDVDYADSSGQTALHLASDRGCLEAVQFLIGQGADINARDKDGISVLQGAVIAEHMEICKLLLEKGAYPDLQDFDGDTPRSCASEISDEWRELFDRYTE